eukprot:TRINITY_DN7318_c0_g2_i1.p1 TRINITY_DN7318_c0_g2~~TRINITY_DN7318_c0_g2_i1.p1  ORF type:complete len:576 (+),score=71.93 TRINITY_DN7318_c0_g2_i1:186-1913(+)
MQPHQTFDCTEHEALRTSSVLGIRRAMMAVLRESAVCELVVILDRSRRTQGRTALWQWRKTALKASLIQWQEKTGLENTTTSVIRPTALGQYELSAAAAGQRRGWRRQQEADTCRMPEYIGNLRHRPYVTTEAARKEHHRRCMVNLRLMALAALQDRCRSRLVHTTRTCQLDGSSGSVCFLQWAFTEQPEVWTVPYPPVADLKQAVVLAEQRAKMADALNSLISEAQALYHWSELVAETKVTPGKTCAKTHQSIPLGAKLLRGALRQPLRRLVGSCFRALQLYHSACKHRLPSPPEAPPEHVAIQPGRFPRLEQSAIASGDHTDTDNPWLTAMMAGRTINDGRTHQAHMQNQLQDHSTHSATITVEGQDAQPDTVTADHSPLLRSKGHGCEESLQMDPGAERSKNHECEESLQNCRQAEKIKNLECEESRQIDREAAAVKIQAGFRGSRTRSHLALHHNSKDALVQNGDSASFMRTTKNAEPSRESFGAVTQPKLPSGRHHRHKVDPKTDGAMTAAAVRIQARVRGGQTRSTLASHRGKKHRSVQNNEGVESRNAFEDDRRNVDVFTSNGERAAD